MKAVIVCDRPVVAEAMGSTLQQRVHATTRIVVDICGCLRLLPAWRPDLAVVDVGLTRPEVRQLCSHLHDTGTRSIHLVDGATDALNLLEVHADGVTTSDDGLEGIATAARAVLGGNTHVPPVLLGGVLRGLIERRREAGGTASDVDRLSAREREVLALLGRGMDQTDIARNLAISPQTAKTHIRHVMTKLGVRSRVAAAAMAADLSRAGART